MGPEASCPSYKTDYETNHCGKCWTTRPFYIYSTVLVIFHNDIDLKCHIVFVHSTVSLLVSLMLLKFSLVCV